MIHQSVLSVLLRHSAVSCHRLPKSNMCSLFHDATTTDHLRTTLSVTRRTLDWGSFTDSHPSVQQLEFQSVFYCALLSSKTDVQRDQAIIRSIADQSLAIINDRLLLSHLITDFRLFFSNLMNICIHSPVLRCMFCFVKRSIKNLFLMNASLSSPYLIHELFHHLR